MRDLKTLDLDSQDMETLHSFLPPKLKLEPRPKRRIPSWLRFAAVVLLAVVCVGGVELLACRFFAPTLYEDIMDPVREKAAAVWIGVRQTGAAVADRAGEAAAALSERAGEARDSFRAWLEEVTAPPPAETLEEDSSLAQPEMAPPYDILDPLISDIVQRYGVEYITGGGLDVVYFNQTDGERSGQMYGSDPLATHGCGPTAMAMAVSSLTEEMVDPEDMAALCVKRGYWSKGHGSNLSIVQGVAEAYGLNCVSVDSENLDEDDFYQQISTGDIFVALMTKGHFTKGGHFILLRGTTLGGEILVADPASRDRSLIPWDLSMILDELSPSRHDGAPLWRLSKE